MTKDLTLSVKIRGEANELSTALDRSEKELQDLGKTASDIRVLEGAEANVRRFEGELQAAQGKVRALQTALSEAYAADADAPLLRRLNTELAAAERAATKAEGALNKSQAAVVKLNLEAGKTGVSTSNLAQASSLLAAETAKVSANIDSLKSKISQAANAEEMLAARTQAVAGAFSTLNLRSAQTIKADIAAIDQALIKLASNSSLTAAEFDRAFAAGQTQIAKLNAELSGLPVEPTAKGIGGLTGAFSSLQGVLGALGISAVGQKFLDANLAADKLQKSLNAVNGDAKKTESDLAFLKETAQRLGINLESSANGFVKLAAAAKGTALEGQATRDIFTGIGGAMAQLGLSSADTERAFVAIGQMMSKGTVSAEELKGQLGDVLPGALQMAARATGLTTQELGKLMETGGLLAEDFLPRFAAEVQKSFGGVAGEVKGLSNTIERVKNTWSELLAVIGQGGGLDILGAAAGAVNGVLVVLATTLGVVVNGIVGLAQSVGVVAGAFATWDFSHVSEGLSEIATRMGATNGKLAAISNRTLGVSDGLTKTGDAAKAAGAAAEQSGAGWNKLIAAYDQAAKSASDYVEQIKKVVKANDEQAGVLVKLAQLSGNENALLLAKEDATRQAAAGAAQLATAIDNEAKALQAKVIALQEEIKGQQNVSADKLKAIEEAKKLAEAKGEEARAALSSADASRVAAAAAQVESAARADNSARVGELKAAYEQAALKVDVLRAAQASGIDVNNELTIAQTEAAKAAALYSDALRDQTDKIGQNLALKQSQISVEQAGIRLQIEQQKGIAATARARGDEYTATQAIITIKELEIKLAELTAKAKAAEAEASLLVVKAKRAELEASGQMTAAKEAELKALEAAAEVKKIEGQIASETARQMKELLETTQLSGGAATNAAADYERLANSIEKVGDSADRASESVSGLNNQSSRASQTAAQQRGVAGVLNQPYGIGSNAYISSGDSTGVLYDPRAEAIKAGATIDNVDEVVRLIQFQMERMIAENGGQLPNVREFDGLATQSVHDYMAREINKNADRNAVPGSSGSTVRVDLRTTQNRQQSINVASQSDAKALIDTLEELQFRTR